METDYEDPARAPYHSASATSFRLDEGFSEDTSTLDEHNRAEYTQRLQEWIMSQSEANRAEIALEILQTLPTSKVAALVDRLTPLLHMDPVEKLPPEITGEIFGYLDAPTLLTACLASHTWRDRILDTRLWLDLFASQGWGVDESELKVFETTLGRRNSHRTRRGKSRVISDDVSEQPKLKKRATSNSYDSRRRQTPVNLPNWGEQHGTPEVDSDVQQDGSDHEMLDAPSSAYASPQRANKRHSHGSEDEMDFLPGPNPSTLGQLGVGLSESSSRFRWHMTTTNEKGEEVVNWAYLYKQRHRLEENWLHGRYNMFQLPDPAYPQEAHTECVYCIQFYGKWLVSGSRDKTLRVWDLETRRLRGRPLTGHSQSVLCLQFDPSEDEDIIVSGSSDSSVIVWKFSTGQKLHEIPSAHGESVLNLRFDHRYLVTCSKDKKIKVWNRRVLSPAHRDFPRVTTSSDAVRAPSYIIDLANTEPSLLEARLANGTVKPIKAFSHLLTFIGHVAAVNAVQINGDLIVSASGDRNIKMWNVSNGRLHKSLAGHAKGIACVQFDSRRIVSGSSDNTVRIFDPISGVEVACLTGHSNLVRTVQAGFGDLPWQVSDDLDEARRQEVKLRAELEMGLIPDREYSRRLRNGEFGSSRSAFGSQLPPGGGGSKWGKIVSGSYDESIIIWRKHPQSGEWTVGQTLRQGTPRSSRRTNRPPQAAAAAHGPPPPTLASAVVPAPVAVTATPTNTPVGPTAGPLVNVQINPAAILSQAMSGSLSSLGAGLSNVVSIARNINGQQLSVPPRSSSGQSSSSSSNNTLGGAENSTPWQVTGPARIRTSYNMQLLGNRLQQNQHDQPATDASQSSIAGHSHGQTIGAPPNAAAFVQAPNTQPRPPAPVVMPQVVVGNIPVAPINPVPNANGNGNANNVSVSRVFKLQFDARRIVCCSQDSRIVGWDFANNDAEIMDCARFFIGA